jgi:biofilm PGA synthesis N-glycosyltransferase PgaC
LAWDSPAVAPKQEFQRKVRTLTGNLQLLQLAPWLLTRANPLRFEFISHKLLRLLVPFALAGALLSAMFLDTRFYRTALYLQIMFYGLGAFAALTSRQGYLRWPASAAFAFLLLNTAAVMALVNFALGKKQVWIR